LNAASCGDAGPALTPLVGTRRYRDQVADALRAALIAGELEPGAVYSATALAARFGVSATPVREALLDLVREDLVDTLPNDAPPLARAHALGRIGPNRGCFS
jgi:DNA-binding GntR family transcriptional regulator